MLFQTSFEITREMGLDQLLNVGGISTTESSIPFKFCVELIVEKDPISWAPLFMCMFPCLISRIMIGHCYQ